jgi:hypothetical protein
LLHESYPFSATILTIVLSRRANQQIIPQLFASDVRRAMRYS